MDMADQNETIKMLRDVTSVYHIGPSFHHQELEIGYNMINAAVEEARMGNFKHFVMASVINTQIRKLMNHDVKRYIEERLIESGLKFTILQPSIFMDVFPIPLLMSQEKPVYMANWNTELPFSFTALKDLGEAGARILCEREKHYLAQYQLVSTDPLTYKEAVGIVSKAIGKNIEIKDRTHEDALKFYMNMLFGLGPHHPISRDTTERLLIYCKLSLLLEMVIHQICKSQSQLMIDSNHSLIGNTNVLEWLLGRKTTSFMELTVSRVAHLREMEK